ncbi:MAG: hypothetical protein WCC01_14670, partial [Acidimicrobiia bacterium]
VQEDSSPSDSSPSGGGGSGDATIAADGGGLSPSALDDEPVDVIEVDETPKRTEPDEPDDDPSAGTDDWGLPNR